ncbi:hypothetical protein ASPZODRAFT_139425 [Penicilliopsis zonata CBS 506.65]|uniref:Endo-1,3(4)-beta-glucanase 1 carbohydrate binding domain-containing protein n=1 Tax=Penicilliopsis zonata CBS 506.65 TaxID=1073090 RepID=A0A1L9SSB5_9EURO|nr:hypothetical protein ASPZODRAFT_139425 [Penicilliopsis zonata CBS 506.65]OJJ50098.1 hypothetical protein ASPZODRAFT_139425 [Penicilliopsis zonata CBS 506.65]
MKSIVFSTFFLAGALAQYCHIGEHYCGYVLLREGFSLPDLEEAIHESPSCAGAESNPANALFSCAPEGHVFCIDNCWGACREIPGPVQDFCEGHGPGLAGRPQGQARRDLKDIKSAATEPEDLKFDDIHSGDPNWQDLHGQESRVKSGWDSPRFDESNRFGSNPLKDIRSDTRIDDFDHQSEKIDGQQERFDRQPQRLDSQPERLDRQPERLNSQPQRLGSQPQKLDSDQQKDASNIDNSKRLDRQPQILNSNQQRDASIPHIDNSKIFDRQPQRLDSNQQKDASMPHIDNSERFGSNQLKDNGLKYDISSGMTDRKETEPRQDNGQKFPDKEWKTSQ